MAAESHSVRIRGKRWKEIESKAWELSSKAKRIIKPTDIVDAILYNGIKEIDVEDVEVAKRTR